MIPNWLHREVDDYFAVPLPLKPATVADIGANVGAFALRAHREWPEAAVVCYEPMPFNVEHLRRNVSPDWCRIVPSAVRAGAGEDDIFVGDLFVTGGFRKGPRQSERTIRVSCVAAADVPSCELVKIDTEGCEVEILGSLDLSATRAIMLEHHSRDDAQTLKRMLSDAFTLVVDGSAAEIGTMVFVRRP